MSALSERDETADICLDTDGKSEPDTELRDHELVPLNDDWRDYVAREVTPFVPDAWVDQTYRDDRDGEIGRVGMRSTSTGIYTNTFRLAHWRR
jgi:type I restriction enzyme M protein